MKLGALKRDKKFEIFDIHPETLAAIEEDMRTNDFDPAWPVIIWKEKNIILDGYTRIEAAKKIGLKEIPTQEKSFPDEKAALLYAIRCQTARRNLTDGDFLRLVPVIDEILPRGGDRRSEGVRSIFENSKLENSPLQTKTDSRERTADLLGISPDKVSYCRAIVEDGDPKLFKEIEKGERTLHNAYFIILENRRRPQKQEKIKALLKKQDTKVLGPSYRKGISHGKYTDYGKKVAHLDKLNTQLIASLSPKEKVMEQIVQGIKYFSNEGIDLTSQPFIQDFVSILEVFGFKVEWPKGIKKKLRTEREKKPREHRGFDISKVHEVGFVSRREGRETEEHWGQIAQRELN